MSGTVFGLSLPAETSSAIPVCRRFWNTCAALPTNIFGLAVGLSYFLVLIQFCKINLVPSMLQRVKVYRLNDDGKWDDQGTGHVTVDYIERSEELGLLVLDEDDNETLLLHRISAEDIYRKQEDTIISWRDPEYSTELALSFQETTGCSYIWDHICTVQRNMHFSSLNNETFHSVNSDLRELPPVELSTLCQILETVVESGIADQLRVTELILHDVRFMNLHDVCLVFRTARAPSSTTLHPPDFSHFSPLPRQAVFNLGPGSLTGAHDSFGICTEFSVAGVISSDPSVSLPASFILIPVLE
uniref:Serine/threonine-protein phosphatase 4 regulatory subunit 3 n=1 Tax=Nicotiana tabacum TaxID=4097 RepID=A0A1S3XGH4_TOBAC|nr:PREDICTED: serine/threonine-protein phosphatase 4 regulatory subunit 3 [Nicotiana tabacum]